MGEVRFDGKVAIVTGGGRGLGREYALELARRGAKVVVNDLGAAPDGSGGSSEAAQDVVREIQSLGGQAIADGASVTDEAGMANMVKAAVEAFGGVDILIANAGILRDKSFAKVEMSDYRAVLDVHLIGTVMAAKAVWPIMRERKYGRIVVTTSGSGLYGNFGQSNYGAAKLGIIGLMNTLKLEGERDGIRVNAISPVAVTRLTEELIPPPVQEKMKAAYVMPGVVYLVSEDAPNGAVLTAGAGAFALSRIYETEGVYLGDAVSVESVRDAWDRIADPEGQRAYAAATEQTQKFMMKAFQA